MIKQIKTYPIRDVHHWIKNKIEPYCSWSLISITNTKEESLTNNEKLILKTVLHCNDILQLQFGDFEPGRYYNVLEDKTMEVPKRILFNKKQANEVILFMEKCQQKKEDEFLVVHCMAGISRSGAIAVFINDILGLDLSVFQNRNPNIAPNPFVLKTLMDVYNSLRIL